MTVRSFISDKLEIESLHRYGEAYGDAVIVLGNRGASRIQISKTGETLDYERCSFIMRYQIDSFGGFKFRFTIYNITCNLQSVLYFSV